MFFKNVSCWLKLIWLYSSFKNIYLCCSAKYNDKISCLLINWLTSKLDSLIPASSLKHVLHLDSRTPHLSGFPFISITFSSGLFAQFLLFSLTVCCSLLLCLRLAYPIHLRILLDSQGSSSWPQKCLHSAWITGSWSHPYPASPTPGGSSIQDSVLIFCFHLLP